MADDAILDVYRREVTPELYTEIRELYKTHSIAEDARDLPGLISTLTPDCVYELVQTGHRWEGHEGAARFYTELLTAFPDIQFDLTDIVIGPQGVCEEANVTATHRGAVARLRADRRARRMGRRHLVPVGREPAALPRREGLRRGHRPAERDLARQEELLPRPERVRPEVVSLLELPHALARVAGVRPGRDRPRVSAGRTTYVRSGPAPCELRADEAHGQSRDDGHHRKSLANMCSS